MAGHYPWPPSLLGQVRVPSTTAADPSGFTKTRDRGATIGACLVLFVMQNSLVFVIVLAGCAAEVPDEADVSQGASGATPMMFRVPGEAGMRITVRLPGAEPITATRLDGELALIAPVRNDDVAQIDIEDEQGASLARAEARVAVPPQRLVLQPIHADEIGRA